MLPLVKKWNIERYSGSCTSAEQPSEKQNKMPAGGSRSDWKGRSQTGPNWDPYSEGRLISGGQLNSVPNRSHDTEYVTSCDAEALYLILSRLSY